MQSARDRFAAFATNPANNRVHHTATCGHSVLTSCSLYGGPLKPRQTHTQSNTFDTIQLSASSPLGSKKDARARPNNLCVVTRVRNPNLGNSGKHGTEI